MEGLDKTVLYQLTIMSYDIEYLKSIVDGKDIMVFAENTIHGEVLEYLKIIDRQLGIDLKYGYVKERGSKH